MRAKKDVTTVVIICEIQPEKIDLAREEFSTIIKTVVANESACTRIRFWAGARCRTVRRTMLEVRLFGLDGSFAAVLRRRRERSLRFDSVNCSGHFARSTCKIAMSSITG